jgi:two-component system NarL family sensor kinase
VHKLNYEKINLTYENFDIVKLAKDVCLELGILLKYRKLEYEFICPDEIMINADKLQLQRVIENIFSNCINHSFPNSKIIVYMLEKDNNLIFKVKNSSSYIKKEILNEIFEKFKTYPSAYNKAGVGLGLYLSKEIIKAHSGKMFAKSYPENINVFGFEIPV